MEIATLLSVGLSNGCLYGLVGLGLVLVYSSQGIPNFAHGELFMAGAFLAYTAIVLLGLPYFLSFLIAVVGIGLMGMLLEWLAIRPISLHRSLGRASSEVAIVLATVGLAIVLKGLARIPWGDSVRNLPTAFTTQTVTIGGVAIATQRLLIVAVTLVLTVAISVFFARAPLGKKMRATAQNPTGAKLIGIHTSNIYSATWALAAACGAIAGVLAAPLIFLHPDMGTRMLLKGFAAACLGGFGSVTGVLLGGVLMGVVEIFAGRYIATSMMDIFAPIIIILVLLFWPQGLFGARRAARV
ncbi:branched-chain amino acid ABC transporter permease [Ancylobacter vacuolatus]|uniref:Branched-chain amino acid transport system permease protein n=1 Tax=Ancylobacter vacuolatus TaxID=223389 RepID=A0ABU0DE69_9HYPH|nr:branched-chain amino acid ABC transporter permease [Ancylobacter vacuolatus]MDQ0346713.1 branched-chain amino acid transport system permease protein [Ancylobacter vacuolatus]